jgi:hypothetical protein
MNKLKRPDAGTSSVCLAIFTIMFIRAHTVNAEPSPFNWWGELGYDFLSSRFESAMDTKEHTALLRLNASGYIREPWLATFDGNIGMHLRRTDTQSNDATSDSLTGNGTLRLFPQSRMPLELFAEKTNSTTDTDLTGLVIDRTRYGFNQRYVSTDGAAFHLGYEHSDLVNISSDAIQQETREDVSDLLKAGFNKSSGAHNVTFDANVNRVDRMDSVDITRTAFSTLRHSYRPSAAFSSEDMLTWNRNDVKLEASDYESEIFQFNSYGFWRPSVNRPLRINGTIRALTRTTDNLVVQSDAQTATSTLGLIYEWTPRWMFNANVGATSASVDDESTVSSFESASAIYTSQTYKPYGFDAGWFGQVDVRNNTDEVVSVQEGGVQLGYNLDRSFLADGKRYLAFNASQSVNALSDSEGFSSQTLLSSVSLSWNRNYTTVRDMVRLSASDSRTMAGGEREADVEGDFQIVNLQASLDNRFSDRSALNANATLQATRSYRPGASGSGSDNNGEWTPTATVDITYFNIGVFDVPHLAFYSTLRFISNTYIPVVGDTSDNGERDDRQWENRLEYRIGRLQLRAISRLSEIRGQKQNYFLFQARRMIGGV